MITKYSRELNQDELINVLTLGQPNKEVMKKQFKEIHQSAWSNSEKHAQHKHFESYLADGQLFTDVHPILSEFIGAYSIASVEIPPWFKTFRNDFIMWLCDKLEENNAEINTEISEYNGDIATLSKKAKKIVETISELNKITPESFDAGKLNNGNKIIKSLISAIEVGVGRKDLEPEKANWYTSYQANKLEGGGKNITITNANIAKIGVSSLFSGHSASSCQKIESGGTANNSYYDAIYSNISDENMVVMFEEGAPITFYTTKNNKLPFTSMKWRTMLRLVHFPKEHYECTNCGTKLLYNNSVCIKCYSRETEKNLSKQKSHIGSEYAIMLDTFYPSANDFKQAYIIVKEIADKIGIPIVISDRSHYTQSGSGCKLDLKKEGSFNGFFVIPNAMSPVKDCTKCSSKKEINTCSSCKPVSDKICVACKSAKAIEIKSSHKCENCSYRKQCILIDCTDCPLTNCKTYKPRAPYFDQLEGRQDWNMSPDKSLEYYDTFHILKGVK